MIEAIEQIYRNNRVAGVSGTLHKLQSAIDKQEGEFIFELIRNDKEILKTLEVGCAHGLSSMHICSALHGRQAADHTIIDPYQMSSWDGVGVTNLKSINVDFFTLIEEGSEFALPKLLEVNEGVFDFIFIDGWHTFDHTLLDCFYATRLLRVGGYLLIDDVSMPSVRRVTNYLLNYPCYRLYGVVHGKEGSKLRENKHPTSRKKKVARALLDPFGQGFWGKLLSPGAYLWLFGDRAEKMIAIKKIEDDNRPWDWHQDAF